MSRSMAKVVYESSLILADQSASRCQIKPFDLDRKGTRTRLRHTLRRTVYHFAGLQTGSHFMPNKFT